MTYAILAYVAAGVLWIVWLLILRAREGRIDRSHPEGDR